MAEDENKKIENKTKTPPTLSSEKRDEAEEKPKTQSPSSNTLIRVLGILVVFILIGGAFFKWSGATQNQNNDAVKKEIEDLNLNIKALEGRLKILEKREPLDKNLETFKTLVNAKFKALEESSKQKTDSKIKTDSKAESEIEKKEDSEKNLKKEELKKVHQNIITAMEKQTSFADIFKAMESLNPSSEFSLLIEPLKKIAPAKVLTKGQLINDFYKVQEAVLKLVPKPSDPAQSILERVQGNIKVSEGKSERTQLKEIFQVTEIHLNQSDLEGAIAALKPYDNKVNIKCWVNQAQERINYDEILEKIKNFKGPL